jgi:hypothetical protein
MGQKETILKNSCMDVERVLCSNQTGKHIGWLAFTIWLAHTQVRIYGTVAQALELARRHWQALVQVWCRASNPRASQHAPKCHSSQCHRQCGCAQPTAGS